MSKRKTTQPIIISIHALREEGDRAGSVRGMAVNLFLSTPSARRATPRPIMRLQVRYNFYPRPPRGGRRCPAALPQHHLPISIHALREEGDVHHGQRAGCQKISIHALREEGDVLAQRCGAALDDFYPRPPRGGRPSLHPAMMVCSLISIHALREEGDLSVDAL